jgi:hypothetical protein
VSGRARVTGQEAGARCRGRTAQDARATDGGRGTSGTTGIAKRLDSDSGRGRPWGQSSRGRRELDAPHRPLTPSPNEPVRRAAGILSACLTGLRFRRPR